MATMLEGVVSGGTGVCAAMPGYPVAGKTGTAKKLLPSGKYSDSAHMASFIGFAPADHPRFAAMVVLDDPAGVYASVTAAPVWSEIMQSALTRYSVPPTDATDVQYKKAQAAKLSGMNCSVPHGAALVTHPASAATTGSLPNDPNPNPNQGH
jgi:membrane peptidoglycan carboxypeptidase